MEVFQDEDVENEVVPDSPHVSDSEPEEGRGRNSAFMTKMMQRVHYASVFSQGKELTASQESAEDDAVTAETPSRGPKGRKVDVFAID